MDQLWKTKSEGDMCPKTYMGNRVLESMVIASVITKESRTIIKKFEGR